MTYEKGAEIAAGKTKIIFGVADQPSLVIVANKNDITAFDDPTFTKKFATKGGYSTVTTCQVFELLRKAGVPVAFKEQASETEFVAERCEMIPLEVVARRYAVGSYLKRHPELERKKGEQPYRFHRLVVELFLKTTGGRLKIGEKTIIEGLSHVVDGVEKTLDDPLITNPEGELWHLFDPKKPAWDSGANLDKTVPMAKIVADANMIEEIINITRKTFLVLEGTWQTLGYRLIDFKIEFGITVTGEVVIADVIDNDSWRLRDAGWNELSKQAFRDGEELSEVEKKYGLVASLTEKFRVPQQAIVLWRGSDKDNFPETPIALKNSGNIEVVKVTLSGHKSPQTSLSKLEEILGEYPDGGVILVKVGGSNGLGPILAARTSWTVVAIPAALKNFPDDIWSNTRMPSSVPLLVACSDGNAFMAALNILGQKNPIAYAERQQAIEELDE
ncbi:MAG: phosphoribosylaminoimidazolesuccinocarboxamide synthase [Patescibacteria group bacterium]